ncbi:MAG: hypothetical protein AOA65_2147 [Candidatus Bathyarchaeota archaeon BA1]|nr:MAG: hypothetical protein AOA65_2147 [Candidatus Bathyarchaeota archaeon BA1]
MLAKRFEVPLEHTYLDTSRAIRSRAYAFLHTINGTSKLLEVIAYILEKGFGPKRPAVEDYNEVLMKYGFAITEENGQFKLIHIPSGMLEQERAKVKSWIEQHANPKVLSHLNDAKDNLSKGRFD